jgi:hypothetical protein
MQIRNLAVSLIALPIAGIIGSALLIADGTFARKTGVQKAPGQSSAARPDTSPPAATRRSGGNAVAFGAAARRPTPAVGRMVPVAQSDDGRRFR